MNPVKTWLKQRLSAQTRQSIKRVVNWPPIIDVAGLKDTVFLAGTGRSGTGWVANIINYRNDRRYIYEPFTPTVLDTLEPFTFGLYVRPGDRDPHLIGPLTEILNGRVGHYPLLDKANNVVFASKRIIKETRANLWMNWMHGLFPEIKIVLLLRHPCASVNSRKKRGNLVHLDHYLVQPRLMEDHLAPVRALLEGAPQMDEFEQRVLMWCINYSVPLRQFKRGEIHLAFYENFSEKPKEEVQRLFDFLGEKPGDEVWAALKKPSEVTKADAAILTGKSVVSYWQNEVTPAQVKRTMEIVAKFGLEKIYGEDPMPDVAAANAMLRA